VLSGLPHTLLNAWHSSLLRAEAWFGQVQPQENAAMVARDNNPHWRRFGRLFLLPACLQAIIPVARAAENNAPGGEIWDWIIVLLVLIFTVASAALPLAACRQWTGAWRGAAIFPLAALGLWVVVIVLGKLGSVLAHPLWPLEIFAWAMLNTIYMVIAMTAKRTLEKADQDGGPSR